MQLSKVILVDHHIATASVNVHNIEEVIDHRPVTKTLPPNARCIIDDVGSCATLIANIILQAECSNECTDVLKFLHGPIVLDTVNFSVAADKTRPLDIAVNERIERALGLDISNRNRLFNELVKARNTVASLNSLQILSKDLKIISNEAETVTVAIPGFPISVQVRLICGVYEKAHVKYEVQYFSRNTCGIPMLIRVCDSSPRNTTLMLYC